jgi:hypothetical protein
MKSVKILLPPDRFDRFSTEYVPGHHWRTNVNIGEEIRGTVRLMRAMRAMRAFFAVVTACDIFAV